MTFTHFVEVILSEYFDMRDFRMSAERKKIIIEEINYWKDHKLLPEEQCNFLLALYTQGEGNDQHLETTYERSFIIYLLLLILLIPFSIIITNFMQISLTFQVLLMILFISFSSLSYYLFKKHQFQYTIIALLTTLILILFTTVFVVNHFFVHSFVLPVIILINFIGWYIFGHWQKIKLLQIISVTSFIFTCFYIIFQFT